MFGPAGCLYVYGIYGMHLCLNVVTGPAGDGSAVLIRALEPDQGVETMARNRGVRDLRDLCSGPAKLCQALGVERSHDGAQLGGEFTIARAREVEPGSIAVTERVGITKGFADPRRYLIEGDPFVSRGVSRGAARRAPRDGAVEPRTPWRS